MPTSKKGKRLMKVLVLIAGLGLIFTSFLPFLPYLLALFY